MDLYKVVMERILQCYPSSDFVNGDLERHTREVVRRVFIIRERHGQLDVRDRYYSMMHYLKIVNLGGRLTPYVEGLLE